MQIRVRPAAVAGVVLLLAGLGATGAAAQASRDDFVASAPTGPSQPTPRTPEGRPDLTGYWRGSRDTRPVGNLGKDYPGFKLPFTPAGDSARIYNVTQTVDPEALCIQGSIPRHNASGLPFEILQTKNVVAILYFYNTYRFIITDGRPIPEDPDPSFFGTAVGEWVGDTLVATITGFKDWKTWGDENANPVSSHRTVIERWTRPDADRIHLEMTMYDTLFYTEPVTYTRTWIAGRPDQHLAEYACNENNVNAAHIGPGPGHIRADGTRGYEYLAPLPPPPSKARPPKTEIPPEQ